VSGPVEVTCDLGVVKVIPFGSEQVQLRMRLGLRGGAPIETVLLLNRTQALQIANGLTSGVLEDLIIASKNVGGALACGRIIPLEHQEALGLALARLR